MTCRFPCLSRTTRTTPITTTAAGGGGGGGSSSVGVGSAMMQAVRLPLGSIRISLGYMTRFDDVWRVAHFIRTTFKDRYEPAAADASSMMTGGDGTSRSGDDGDVPLAHHWLVADGC